MKTAKNFIIGERVQHINHGWGSINAFDNSDDSAIFVEFDIKPDGWDKILDVSIACLRKVEKQPLYKIRDKFERKNFEYEIVAVVRHETEESFVYMVKQRKLGSEEIKYDVFNEDTFALYKNIN